MKIQKSKTNKAFTLTEAAVVVGIVLIGAASLAASGFVIYVAWHFIQKAW